MRYWIVALMVVALVMVGGVAVAAQDKGTSKTAEKLTTMKPEIRLVPKMTVAYVRHTGPYEKAEVAWQKLMAWAGKNGVVGPDTVFAGVGYDDPETTPADKIRYDACITVPKGTKAEGEVRLQEIGGHKYAIFIHRGPCDTLKNTYDYIYKKWAPATKPNISYDHALEIYKNDPETTSPAELITEVCVPLKE